MKRPEGPSRWIEKTDPDYREIWGKDCMIILQARPRYCDRGNFLAMIFVIDPASVGARDLSLDGADGWPRYYMDLDRGKLEIEAWLKKRKQFVE